MVDRTILSCCVAALQTDEQRPFALGVHQVLEIMYLLDIVLNLWQGLFMAYMLILKAGINLGKIHFTAWFDNEFLRIIHSIHLSC
jgi:hypothetical protein